LPSEPTEFGRLFGRSDAMQRLFRVLERVSDTEATVLLSGETGVGKSLVARSLHAHSRRREQPLIVVDCAALPPTLIESELFGHEKGSFTGADQGRDGAFQAAHRGTLFLDEIGELPLDLQPKFLRSIEERVVKRVGATEAQPFDVRLIAASNRDLQAMVKEGSFRSDLYYRLDVVRLRVPPLRERRPDIRPLAEGFIQAAGAEHAPELSESEWTAIINAPWPGNVRELRTAVERALVLGDKSLLVSAGSGAAELERPEIDWTVPFREAKRKVVDAFERAYVSRLVTETEGNLSAAARRAKMDRNYLRTLVSRHLADE
jgi:DNA-binding NtrC family response regulator